MVAKRNSKVKMIVSESIPIYICLIHQISRLSQIIKSAKLGYPGLLNKRELIPEYKERLKRLINSYAKIVTKEAGGLYP